MRKILSFLMMTLFASFAMADSYVKVTATPSDWEGDYLFVYEAENVAFNGGLATLDAAANTIAVEIADGVIAANETTNAAKFTLAAVEGGYSVKSASGKYIGVSSYGNGLKQADDVGSYVHNSMSIDADGNAIIAIYNETWNTTGGSMILNYNSNKSDKRFRYYKNGSQKKIQLYKFTASSTPDPDPTTRTLYCKVAQSWWKADGAAVGIYAFTGEEHNAAWPGERMTLAENETEVWTATIDAKYEKVIFVRVNASGDIADWGAKTADLTLADAGENNLYTVTSSSAVWGDPGVTGEWSKYSPSEPPAPAEPDSIYFVNVPGWDNLRVHLWGGTAAGTTWPGVEMTKLGEDDQINGYVVYKYVADKGAYTQCIFSNNGENQTVDLNWTSGKYYYDGAWYDKADIPEPIPAAVPLEGNIWKVTAETLVRAGSHYIDEALLKVDGVYATTLKPNTRTIAGEEFTHAIQVRTDGYPTQDVLAGKEKSGSTSLIITAKENADITLYYNRQAVDATGTENDNKDLIVFDQADINTKVTGEFKVIEVLEGNSYLNATKKIALKKDHVYTVTASGTTLQLHGIKLEEHIPAMQIAGAWDVKEEAWVVNNMTLAGDAKTATYEVELSKGDYEFKVLKDGAWLTKANEGAYGLHREWPGVAGVTDDAANNLKLTADAAGKYIFTWTFANDSIGITFPAPEVPAKFYITGNAALVGDELTWNPAAIKSTEDSYELDLLAGKEYRMKVTVDGTWETAKGIDDITERADGLIDMNGNIGFCLKENGKVKVTYTGEAFKLEGNFVETPIVKTYFATTGAWAEDAESNVVVNEDKSLTVNIVKSKEAAWQAQIHYQAPVAKAGKLYDLSLKFKASNAINGVIVKYQDNMEMLFDNQIALEKDVELAYTKTDLVGKDGGNGILVFDFGFAPANTVITISEITFTEKEAPEPVVLADGFYLIGRIGGVDGWDASALKAENKFGPNLDNPVEFMLNVTLAEGDEIQVVNVLNSAITAWFPGGEGNNFIVTAAYAGEKTVYFRPDNQGGEGWHHGCIYIAPNQGTGISNTAVDGKAVKMIMDGQLLIIRNGKTYNVQGQQVR